MSKLLQCRSSEFVMVQGLADFPLLISQGLLLVWGTIVSATRCWILTKSLHKMQDMSLKLTDAFRLTVWIANYNPRKYQANGFLCGFRTWMLYKASGLLTGLCVRRQYLSTKQQYLKMRLLFTENTMRLYYNDHPVNVLETRQLFSVKIDTKYTNCPSKMSRFRMLDQVVQTVTTVLYKVNWREILKFVFRI